MIKNWKYILVIGASFTFTTAFSQSVQDAQRAIELERYNESKRMLRQLGTDEATFYLGDAYLRSGKPDSAAIFYSQGFAANPKSAISMVGAGKAALLKGNTGEAERLFESAAKATKSKNPEILRLIGQAYADAKSKNPAKAIEYLNQANKVAKNSSTPVFVTLGDLHLVDPNGGGAAATAYDQALTADRNYAKAHLRRGQLFVSAKNYNEAQQALQAAITADPNYAPAYRELGEMYIRVGKYPEAVDSYKKYLSMSENSLDDPAKYAQFLYLAKEYAQAKDQAQAVVSKSPNHVIGNRVLALAMLETGDDAQAMAAMDNFFKNAKPEEIIPADYANYGRILAKAGNTDLAQTNFDKALQLDPQNPDLQDDIAAFYVKQKQYPKAIALYRAKIAAKPSNVDNIKLADAYLAAKQYKSADSLYAVVLQTNPNYSYAHLRRAEAAEAQERDAKPMYEEYIRVVNADPTKVTANKAGLLKANYYIGYQAYKAKDYATARKYWQQAQSLDPGNKEIASALRNIDVVTKGKK